MDEPAAVLLAGMRQMLYGYDIGCTGLTLMRFTKIGLRQGGGIDNPSGQTSLKEPALLPHGVSARINR